MSYSMSKTWTSYVKTIDSCRVCISLAYIGWMLYTLCFLLNAHTKLGSDLAVNQNAFSGGAQLLWWALRLAILLAALGEILLLLSEWQHKKTLCECHTRDNFLCDSAFEHCDSYNDCRLSPTLLFHTQRPLGLWLFWFNYCSSGRSAAVWTFLWLVVIHSKGLSIIGLTKCTYLRCKTYLLLQWSAQKVAFVKTSDFFTTISFL